MGSSTEFTHPLAEQLYRRANEIVSPQKHPALKWELEKKIKEVAHNQRFQQDPELYMTEWKGEDMNSFNQRVWSLINQFMKTVQDENNNNTPC